MEKTSKNISVIILSIIFFLLIANNNSWIFFFDSLEGQYILHSDGTCHFLSYDTDTLFLKKDGSVISRNFPGNATYKVIETGFLKKQIKIRFNAIYTSGIQIMNMPIKRTLFGPTKFVICVDRQTYYYKI